MQLKVRKTLTLSNLQKLSYLPLLIPQCIFSTNKFFLTNLRKSRSSNFFLRREERKLGHALSVRSVSSPTSLRSLKGFRSRNNMSLSSHAMLHLSRREASKLTSLRRLFLRSCMLRWWAIATRLHLKI